MATATFTATFTTHGTETWVAPITGTVNAQCWAGGGGGGGGDVGTGNAGGAGGGGEYAAEPSNSVTATDSYTVVVGAAGTAGNANGAGGNGGNSTFSGTGATTVTANFGHGGPTNASPGGAGGTGSTNTSHENGGQGGAGHTSGSGSDGGGGGGGSGGTGSAGNTGGSSSGSGAGSAATAVTGGGPGGTGGTGAGSFGTTGSAPVSGPGGGGGAGGIGNSSSSAGGAGFAGQAVVTWTMNSPASLPSSTSGGVYTWTCPAGITTVAWTISGTANFNGNTSTGSGTVTPGTAYTYSVGASGSLTLTWPAASTSPYIPPASAKGARAARPGRGYGHQGAAFVFIPPSPFYQPGKPSRGAQAARCGTSAGAKGAPLVTFPSVFTPPRKPSRGARSAVKGHSGGLPGKYTPPPPPVVVSPFTPPHGPSRGRMAARPGRIAGTVMGQGAPFVPRSLIISIASKAGTDDYGNPFPEGIQVGSGTNQAQVQIIPGAGGGAAQIKFPLPAIALSNAPNMAAGIADNTAVQLISGPALSTTGKKDWVQLELWANDGGSNPSRFQFNTIDTNGNVTDAGSLVNGSGWTFSDSVSMTDGLTVTGGETVDDLTASGTVTADSFVLDLDGQMTSPNGNGVFGWSETGDYPASTGSSTFGGGAGCSLSTGDFNATAISDLETLQDVANSASALANYIYLVLQDAGIIAGG